MGINRSRPKKHGSHDKSKPNRQMDEYEDLELNLLRVAIEKTPESFILNNLMMCIQFFENYEEDMSQIKETLKRGMKLNDEAEFNKVLPPQKRILLPDVLQNRIACNVDFTSKRQTGDLIIEPLQPVRIFIVHDNIEITEQDYLSEYSCLNNEITYNMMVQQSEYPGYVRLRRLDETPYTRTLNKEEDDSAVADDDEIYDGDCESIGHNSNMTFPHQTKRNGRQSNQIFSVRSLPNLLDDKTIYEDKVSVYLSRENIYGTRSDHDIKAESDCEHTSLAKNRRGNGKKASRTKDEPDAGKGNQRYGSAKPARQKVRRPTSSTSSSGYRSIGDSDSDWGYQTVTANRNVTHDKTSADAPKIYSNAMLPAQCFRKVRINGEGRIYTMREERRQPQNSKQFRLMMAARQYDCEVFYTSSETFMSYFVDLFVDQLAEPLGFKSEDLNHVEDSVIHCDKVIETHSPGQRRIDSYEITPTIWLQWPKYAEEWLDRSRSTWPHDDDIDRIKKEGCYVVPENSLPTKKGYLPRESRHQDVRRNIYQEIEWQLTFPTAERYLETCMTRSQMQVYLIALMLHKTFLRPVLDTMYGLTTAHIRHKMFWLIEENDSSWKWPDNRAGHRLIYLLNSLYHCISQNEPILPDYFVRGKNMFQKVPRDYLLYSQKQLKRIIENPIMYVFYAMENIKHSDQFFPSLNFAELFKILTIRPSLALVNPGLDIYMSPSRTTEESHRDEIYGSDDFWDRNRRKNPSTARRSTYGVNKTLIMPRKATDSIVEISERCGELKGPRLAALLDFFVAHFIKMAECCHRYRAYKQKNVYLDQADRLSIILSEQIRHKEDAKAYRSKIYTLRKKATASSAMRSPNEPPETPKRNLMEPLFVSTMKDRFTRHTAEIVTPREQQPMPWEQQPTPRKPQSTPREPQSTPREPQPTPNERPQSAREDNTDNMPTKSANRTGVQFKDENNAQATTDDEDPYSTSKSTPKDQSDQSDESASGTIQKGVSLTDNLNDATYI